MREHLGGPCLRAGSRVCQPFIWVCLWVWVCMCVCVGVHVACVCMRVAAGMTGGMCEVVCEHLSLCSCMAACPGVLVSVQGVSATGAWTCLSFRGHVYFSVVPAGVNVQGRVSVVCVVVVQP